MTYSKKMKRILAVAALSLSTLVIIPIVPNIAMAGVRKVRIFSTRKYGVVCIKNSTDRLITYQTKWGNNRRGKIVSISPGDSWSHSFTNKQVEPGRYERSPSLQINFTAGYGGALRNKPIRRSYSLNPRGANSQRCDEGHLYELKKRGRYIDLYYIQQRQRSYTR